MIHTSINHFMPPPSVANSLLLFYYTLTVLPLITKFLRVPTPDFTNTDRRGRRNGTRKKLKEFQMRNPVSGRRPSIVLNERLIGVFPTVYFKCQLFSLFNCSKTNSGFFALTIMLYLKKNKRVARIRYCIFAGI